MFYPSQNIFISKNFEEIYMMKKTEFLPIAKFYTAIYYHIPLSLNFKSMSSQVMKPINTL